MSTIESSSSPETSTAQLARRAVAGDKKALEEIAARTMPKLHAWFSVQLRASRPLGVEPSDCVNEVWLRAIAGLTSMSPDAGSMRAWLFGIAKNVIRELRHRPLQRGFGPSAQNQEQSLSTFADSITRISDVIARSERQQLLHKILAELDTEDSMLITLHGLEGRTLREAALKLGISHDAASKRWQRLRKHLQDRQADTGLFDLDE